MINAPDQTVSTPDPTGALRRLSRRVQRAVLWRALRGLRALGLAPPEQHFLSHVGHTRHVQNTLETGERQNPDDAVGRFLSAPERMLARLEDVSLYRREPFYHYLLARTRFYDEVLRDALAQGFTQIMVFGVGSDTRSFRFGHEIDNAGARVIETDLEPWISRRAKLAIGMKGPRDFHHAEINLESGDVEGWAGRTQLDRKRRTLFVAEGVTPYLSPAGHAAFLKFVSECAAPGSRLAYDGKFPPMGGTQDTHFRMPREAAALSRLHEPFGLDLKEVLTSAEANARFLRYEAPVFEEDVLLVAERR